MVFSVSPAVTIREIDATANIPAIATPPAAIAGVFRWGPINERVLVTSESELVARFGKPATYSNTVANTSWTNHETFFTAADYLSYANALFVTRVISEADPASLTAANTDFSALYPGALGNALEVSYVASAGAYSSTLTDASLITTAGNITFNGNTFVIETSEDFSADIGPGDILRVGNDSVGYQNLVVSTISTTVDTGNTEANTSLDDVYTHTLTFKNRYTLSELDYNSISYVRQWGYANLVTRAPSTGSMHIVVADRTGAITGIAGSILEVYEDVSKSENAVLTDGTTNYVRNVIENRSSWITVNDASSIETATDSGYQFLTGGDDGLGEVGVPFSKLAAGYDLYRDAAEVDISFVLQGKATSTNVANYIVQNICENRRDCMAFLSPMLSDVVTPTNPQVKLDNVIAYRNGLQNSSYWFLDSGYKYRYDKYNDLYRWVPLNGDMAGLAARVAPWESPAGYKRGLIKNVVKLAFNPNKEHRDQLYVRDINPVITQIGQGTLLFGDKTGLGLSSAFNRINVRRLFIVVEKAIATASSSFLFDFNDEFTQTQFRNLVEPFLRDIQGQRGIIDFRVISDTSVNTPDVIDANKFRANIFIKPSRTINFIELTFVATRTGVEFDEIVGQAL